MPTVRIERMRKGLRVRRSKTKATIKVDVATSRGKLKLLFRTYI